MARIRTIKPEFWTDDRVGECSVSARLLFIAAWNFADDKGGLDRSAKQLKAQAFPYDVIDCEPLVQELIRQGLLIEYEAQGRKYLHINGFLKHQKIDNPAKARIPPYEEPPEKAEDSPRPTGGLAAEGKGKESKGREDKSESAPDVSRGTGEAEKLYLAALDEWRDVADVCTSAGEAWIAYCQTELKPPKKLEPLARIAMAKILAGIGDAAAQHAAVDHCIAGGFRNLRITDGKSGAPAHSGKKVWTPDPDEERRAAARLRPAAGGG